MTLEIAITLAAIVGLFFGAVIGTAFGIKDEAKKKDKYYSNLIVDVMKDAYNAGKIDALTEGKKRPSGNGGK